MVSRKLFPQLDGLRGLAALTILAHHFWPQSARYDWSGGRIGVDIFFLMSGFLITRSLWHTRLTRNGPSSETLKAFYVRRFWRIVPACYVALTLALLMPAERSISLFWHATFLSNWYFIVEHHFVGAGGHFWALAIEQQFYWVWPLLVLFLPIKRVPIVAIVMIALGIGSRYLAALLHWSPLTVNIMTPGAFETLGAGAALAFWMRGQEDTPERFGATISAVGLGGVLLWGLRHLHGINLTHGQGLLWTEFNRSLFLTWIMAQTVWGIPGGLGSLLESTAARALGAWSYQIYLCHNYFFGISHSRPFHVRPLSIEETQTCLAFIATFVWSITLYQLLEKPLLRWSSTVRKPLSSSGHRSSDRLQFQLDSTSPIRR